MHLIWRGTRMLLPCSHIYCFFVEMHCRALSWCMIPMHLLSRIQIPPNSLFHASNLAANPWRPPIVRSCTQNHANKEDAHNIRFEFGSLGRLDACLCPSTVDVSVHSRDPVSSERPAFWATHTPKSTRPQTLACSAEEMLNSIARTNFNNLCFFPPFPPFIWTRVQVIPHIEPLTCGGKTERDRCDTFEL